MFALTQRRNLCKIRKAEEHGPPCPNSESFGNLKLCVSRNAILSNVPSTCDPPWPPFLGRNQGHILSGWTVNGFFWASSQWDSLLVRKNMKAAWKVGIIQSIRGRGWGLVSECHVETSTSKRFFLAELQCWDSHRTHHLTWDTGCSGYLWGYPQGDWHREANTGTKSHQWHLSAALVRGRWEERFSVNTGFTRPLCHKFCIIFFKYLYTI